MNRPETDSRNFQWNKPLLAVLFLCASVSFAQAQINVDGSVPSVPLPSMARQDLRIAAFRGDRAGAISYTFDDGLRNQYLLAAPILNGLGLRATFFIVPGRVAATQAEAEAKKPGELGGVTWDEIRELSAMGHEIGNHTWSHTGLKGIDDDRANEQLSKADDKIEAEVGIFPISFAYPGNQRDEHSRELVLRRHVEAREHETRMGKEHTTPKWLNAWADRQATEHQWGVGMIHGVVDGFDPIDPEVLRQHLTYVKQRGADLWVDTFGTIARYIRERDSAQLRVVSQTPQSIVFILDTPLSRPPFDVPLTVIVPAPGVTSGEARSGDRALPCQASAGVLHVECVPSPDKITVTWSGGSGVAPAPAGSQPEGSGTPVSGDPLRTSNAGAK